MSAPLLQYNIRLQCQQPVSHAGLLAVGERGVATPPNECEVGQGPNGAGMVEGFGGGGGAEQSVIDF